ncbi:PREDICTED: zinc finger protein 436-like [Tinamus guttatus]|uniref:zinc finger protein 436-like n=1 Tax=Tinamus guttatus TaxID=94827 RepID=UPI00052F06D7|nr:PREDICTED: zinc finger protein 436-like [Tinamus guttatus]
MGPQRSRNQAAAGFPSREDLKRACTKPLGRSGGYSPASARAESGAQLKMELATEPMFSQLQEAAKSEIAGGPCAAETCILSENEENEAERGIQEALDQDMLPQPPDAHSLDWRAASLQKPQRVRCNKLTRQAGGFKKLTALVNHQKAHTEDKPFRCAECGRGFKGSSTLLNHLKIHTGENAFECLECGKSFNRKANLVVHEKVHRGERPYKCKECEKSFGRSSNLIAHYKTHAKKKVFSCGICSKSFSGSSALFQHQRIHMDEKPYRCAECGNSFCLCSNFIEHQKIHLRERHSEDIADANRSEFISLHHKEQQRRDTEKLEMDRWNLIFEELKKMRENMDMLLLNQQSQLQVLQEIQKQLNILLPGNDLINSNVYSLGLLLGRQAAAVASLSFPLLNPSSLLTENAPLLSRLSAPEILSVSQLTGSQFHATSTTS